MIYILEFLLGVLNTSTIYSYIIFVVLGFGVILLEKWKKRDLTLKLDKCYTILVLGVLAMWLWGFFVGLLNGNNVLFVVRNFAGILLYINFFLLQVVDVNVERVIKCVFSIGIFVLVCVLIARVLYASIGAPQVYKTDTLRWLLGKIDGNDGVYSRVSIRIASESALFPLVSISLYKVIYTSKKRIFYLLILIITVIEIIWTRSDGYLLALIVLVAIGGLGFVVNSGKSRVHLLFAALGMMLLFCIVLVNTEEIINLILKFFTANDEGNAIRYNQLNSIASELNVFGNGLGATFQTVNKEKDFPYSIEVIYLNIVHKFGVFALIYFTSLIKTYFDCIKNICINRAVYEMYVCIGLMSYCVIALGNPILFAPQNVIFHTIVLYVLKKINCHNKKQRNTILREKEVCVCLQEKHY